MCECVDLEPAKTESVAGFAPKMAGSREREQKESTAETDERHLRQIGQI